MSRKAGILLPIFSLPSEYGIGTLGRAAYRWVDFLNDAHTYNKSFSPHWAPPKRIYTF